MSTIAAEASSSLLTAAERERAAAYLISSRDRLLQSVESLSEPQWHYQPDPARWSIALVLEHIVIIESRVHANVGRMPEAAAAGPDRVPSQVDEMILTTVPVRETKFQAPPPICPTGQWSPAETVARFIEGRALTLRLLEEAPALRGRVIPHPIMGPWDGYQWILAAAAHGARHTEQIEEVKAGPGFPSV